ncbi:PQQ-binding-like beta-propeller repeat protein [Marivirga salinae]|uniref:PQQ-binding-like beta-propeller repeat protein n=1 Tax=Marivirga salinarum TaxID=3059078 RepID=A0AA49JGN1_9BACT|nr:PQQ-binding-like beta-propeller repeat protein [Marivirga sp. BDSF4-3]WKK74939.2 PQQ-binding-like beta-propeller repeat protein [Marivirga sp. BDSF4-3]
MKYTTTIALILFLYFQGTSQEITNIYADKSLDEVLKPKWEYPYEKNDFSHYFSKYPLIKNDLLIHHFNMDFVVDLKSSKQLFFSITSDQQVIKSRLPDSLLVYDLMDKLVIKNIFTGKNFLTKRKYKKFGFISDGDYPYFLKDSVIYYLEDKNKLFAFNPFTKNEVWQSEFPETVYTFQEYKDNLINLTTRTTFYQLDKNTGETIWSLPIITEGESSLNGELNKQGDKLYLWAESFGLNVVNLNTRQIESTWLKGRDNSDFTMQMIFENDSIFARTPMNVYCISKTTGEVYWISDDVKIVSDITLTDDYIFFEQNGKEGLAGVITVLNRHTHKIEYAQFTSEKYPPTDDNYQNQLDLSKIQFLERPYNKKYLLGSSLHNVYCFEIISIIDE